MLNPGTWYEPFDKREEAISFVLKMKNMSKLRESNNFLLNTLEVPEAKNRSSD